MFESGSNVLNYGDVLLVAYQGRFTVDN